MQLEDIYVIAGFEDSLFASQASACFRKRHMRSSEHELSVMQVIHDLWRRKNVADALDCTRTPSK
jgi:hypothetical protein